MDVPALVKLVVPWLLGVAGSIFSFFWGEKRARRRLMESADKKTFEALESLLPAPEEMMQYAVSKDIELCKRILKKAQVGLLQAAFDPRNAFHSDKLHVAVSELHSAVTAERAHLDQIMREDTAERMRSRDADSDFLRKYRQLRGQAKKELIL